MKGVGKNELAKSEEERSRLGFYTTTTGLDLSLVQGESSSTAVAVEDCDGLAMVVAEDDARDWQHKRAKVNAGSPHNHYAATWSRDSDSSVAYLDTHFNICSSSSSSAAKTELSFHTFLLNDVTIGHPHHLDYPKDMDEDGSEIGSPKTEDEEVRMDLTDDLLHMVLSFLCHTDLCSVAMVCRQWRAASAHEDFWRCLNFENSNISVEQFEDMCVRYPNATELNIVGAFASRLLVMTALSSLRNLEVLNLGKVHLEDTFFQALAGCNVLRSLNVTEAILGNGMQEIPVNHDRLRQVHLIRCRVMRISVRCPKLETLSLKRSNMAHAQLNCPLLNDLDIGSCHKLSDAAIRSAAILCPLLESLDMSNCSCVSDDTLREIAHNCANLHVLNASYCPSLSLESVKLPMLTILKLDNCDGITSASMVAVSYSTVLELCSQLKDACLTATAASCPQIESLILMSCPSIGNAGLHSLCGLPRLMTLDLSYTFLTSLMPVFESCLQLKVLKLQACKYLVDSPLEPLYKHGALPTLCELDLSYGPICQSAIEELLACCMNLTHVNLNGCINMHDLNWGTPTPSRHLSKPLLHATQCKNLAEGPEKEENSEGRLLQILNCVGCPNIKKVLIPSAACCLHLSSLNLSLSANLKEVDIACLNLCILNLSNCCSLEMLKLDCPRLTSLFLQSCNIDEETLEAAVSQCGMLETLDVRFCPKLYWESMGRLRSSCHSLKRIYSSHLSHPL